MSALIRRIINTAKAPAPIGPYSQAVLVDRTLYISGQVGMDPASGQLVEGGVQAQTRQLSKLQFSWPALTTSPLSTIFTHSSSLRTTQPELPTRSLLSQKVDWWKLKQLLLWAL